MGRRPEIGVDPRTCQHWLVKSGHTTWSSVVQSLCYGTLSYTKLSQFDVSRLCHELNTLGSIWERVPECTRLPAYRYPPYADFEGEIEQSAILSSILGVPRIWQTSADNRVHHRKRNGGREP